MIPSPARTRPSRRAIWLVGCSLLSSLVLAGPARAAPLAAPSETPATETELVLIRVLPDDPALRARLEAELDLAGFDSAVLDWAEPEAVLGPSLLDELEPRGANAAIEIHIRDERVEVWVADATTGTALTRRFEREAQARDQARTLAVGAVELLRASRLEYAEREAQRPGPSPVDDEDPFAEGGEPKVPEPEPEPFEPKVSLSLAPLIGGSPGGLGTTAHLEAASRWVVRRPFVLAFDIWIPVFANQSQDQPGVAARSFLTMGFVEPQWSPRLERVPWLHPTLGLGLGVAVLSTQGEIAGEEAGGTAVPVDDVVAGFALNARMELAFALHPRVWLRTSAHLGIVQPAFRLNILARQYTYGLPVGAGSLGIEFWI